MKTRVITSIVSLALLAAVLVFFETIFFNIVFSAVCLIAIHEIYNAYGFTKKHLYIYVGFAAMAVVVMLADNPYVISILRPSAFIFILYLVVCTIKSFSDANFSNISGLAVFSAIVVFCFYSFVYLKMCFPTATHGFDATYFLVLSLGFAWGGDTFAYLAGNAFGKRKLAPNISPNKTIEGAIGAIGGSVLIGLIITFIYMQIAGGILSFDKSNIIYYVVVAVIGVISSVLGIMGDLFASTVKRQCEIKDYGTIFPGHGGILDRFDSVLFIAPFIAIVSTVMDRALQLT